MACDYDPAKAVANMAKHRVSFADAEGVFFDPFAITVPDPDSTNEGRFVTLGLGSNGELFVVVWTERGDTIRLISARRPTRKERFDYEK